MSNRGELQENLKAPLLEYSFSDLQKEQVRFYNDEEIPLHQRVWIETKKLWRIVGPAIFSRIASYSMFVITQAFAGHLGDLELAGVSIATTVILGFDFGLLVLIVINPFMLYLNMIFIQI